MSRLIYVASPYAARDGYTISENRLLAIKMCREVIRRGEIPVAPHLYFPQFLDDDDERDRLRGTSLALKALDVCDEFWYVLENAESMVAQEFLHAKDKGIRCITFTRRDFCHE